MGSSAGSHAPCLWIPVVLGSLLRSLLLHPTCEGALWKAVQQQSRSPGPPAAPLLGSGVGPEWCPPTPIPASGLDPQGCRCRRSRRQHQWCSCFHPRGSLTTQQTPVSPCGSTAWLSLPTPDLQGESNSLCSCCSIWQLHRLWGGVWPRLGRGLHLRGESCVSGSYCGCC